VSTLASGFNQPGGIAVDGSGNVYVVDTNNNVIKKITGGTVSVIAGSGSTGSTDATGTSASFYYPQGLAINSSATTLYVGDRVNNKIRTINLASGAVTTLAGSGSRAYQDGVGTAASFDYPTGVALDSTNTYLYVADEDNNVIRQVNVNTGAVTTYAGGGLGLSGGVPIAGEGGGTALTCGLNGPQVVAIDSLGNVYTDIQGSGYTEIVEIPVGGGSLVQAQTSGYYYGNTSDSIIFNATGFVVDSGGNIYGTGGNSSDMVWVLGANRPSNNINFLWSSLAGQNSTGTTNGTGYNASFDDPTFLTLGPTGILYVSDTGNGLIREIQ
jgi:DNA-binding beta-propeller fold protein YncE